VADHPRVGTRYRPFPPFAKWPLVPLNRHRWDEIAGRLARQREWSPAAAWARVPRVALRAATLDAARSAADDAPEPADAATQASWRQAFAAKGLPGVQALYEAEVGAHELVAGAAAAGVPLTEELLLRIHEELIASHEQYPVRRGDDVVLEDVPAGRFKAYENFGLMPDGRLHAYAPVEHVGREVTRLCAEVGSEAFAAAHPVHQAAYLLHATDAIHPFADGNGRVARAVASLPLYRAVGLPLVVTPTSRGEYLDSLERVERDDGRTLVEFVYRRAMEGMTQAFDVLAASALS
jgi:fido (protein-threonine AMPylation protein)